LKGFLESEMKKDELIPSDPEDNPDAPKPREMTDLEVKHFILILIKSLFVFLLRLFWRNWIMILKKSIQMLMHFSKILMN
jgi:hypothetical protein